MIEGIRFAAMVIAISFMIVCTIEDVLKKQICLRETGIFVAANLVLAWCERVGWRMLISGMVLGIFFMIISICTKEKIGKGDAILIMGTGSYLGGMGGLIVVFSALLLALVYGLFLVWKKKGWAYEMAFVPFLLIPYTGAVVLHFFYQ